MLINRASDSNNRHDVATVFAYRTQQYGGCAMAAFAGLAVYSRSVDELMI